MSYGSWKKRHDGVSNEVNVIELRGEGRNGGRALDCFFRFGLELRCFFTHALNLAIVTFIKSGEQMKKRAGGGSHSYIPAAAKLDTAGHVTLFISVESGHLQTDNNLR